MSRPSPDRWRPMTHADLPRVEQVAATVHPNYPEDAAVFAERLQLYPAGCFVLDDDRALGGYAIAHPWRFGQPPALNTALRALPTPADTFYIHDLALLATMRGTGLAGQVVALLVEQARRAGCDNLTLVAVNASQGFWSRHGFAVVPPDALGGKLASYGAAAAFMTRALAPPLRRPPLDARRDRLRRQRAMRDLGRVRHAERR